MATDDKGKDFVSRTREYAAEMGLEGEEAETFVEQAVTRRGGFKKVTTWVPDDGDAGTGSGKPKGWFPNQ